MKAPKCKLCGKNHWLSEPHVFKDVVALAEHGAKQPIAQTVQGISGDEYAVQFERPVTNTVTTVTPTATRYVSVEPIAGQPCPTCGQVVPKYKTNAERQKAYRDRK